jgi:uncharacterized membrane protein
MSDRASVGWFQRLGRVVTGWPRLFIAAAVAVVVMIASLALGALPITAILIGWDIGVIFFLAALVELMISADPAEIRRHAARQDVGQTVVLTLSAIASLASVVAIYAEVSRRGDGSIAAWRLGLGVATIVLSWFFVHAIFAMRYAHEYYRPDRAEAGGLAFPGQRPEPDYWDFFYFALVIGMSSQVSDVAVTSPRIRKTVTAHAIVAFWFNVAVLALLINIAANAIGG